MKLYLYSLVASFLSSTTVTAFSQGAGRCVVGEAAPASIHLSGTPTTGSLSDGGYSVSVNGESVTGSVTLTGLVGTPFDVSIAGPDFRGVLIMVAGQPDSVLAPGPGLQLNVVGQGCPGTASITHTGPDIKQVALGTVTVDAPLETTLELNIVVQNSNGVSTYYYSQIGLVVTDEEVADTDAPEPTAAPVAATLAPVVEVPVSDTDCTVVDNAMDACMDSAGLSDQDNDACDTCLVLAAEAAVADGVSCEMLSSGDSALCTAVSACPTCPEACAAQAEALVLCEVNEELVNDCAELVCADAETLAPALPEVVTPTLAPMAIPETEPPTATPETDAPTPATTMTEAPEMNVTLAPTPANATDLLMGNATDSPNATEPPAMETIVDVVVGNDSLETLETAVIAADFVDVLSSDGPFTVFGPTNEAFAALGETATVYLEPAWKAHLQFLLLFHVADGTIPSANVTDGLMFTTKIPEPENITAEVMDTDVMFSGAAFSMSKVVEADLMASNGVVHVVDKVFIPTQLTLSIYDAAAASEGFETVVTLIAAAGLEDVLSKEVVTVFTPSNEAFEALDPAFISELAMDTEKVTLLLSNHVVNGVWPTALLTDGLELTSLAEETLTISVGDGPTYMVNNSLLSAQQTLSLAMGSHKSSMRS